MRASLVLCHVNRWRLAVVTNANSSLQGWEVASNSQQSVLSWKEEMRRCWTSLMQASEPQLTLLRHMNTNLKLVFGQLVLRWDLLASNASAVCYLSVALQRALGRSLGINCEKGTKLFWRSMPRSSQDPDSELQCEPLRFWASKKAMQTAESPPGRSVWFSTISILCACKTRINTDSWSAVSLACKKHGWQLFPGAQGTDGKGVTMGSTIILSTVFSYSCRCCCSWTRDGY